MGKILFSVGLVLASTCIGHALTAEDATTALSDGAWTGPAETWLFTDQGEWVQYVGGVKYETRYTVEQMPANLARIVSSSGKSYVFHFSVDRTSVAVSTEGEGRPQWYMLKDTAN